MTITTEKEEGYGTALKSNTCISCEVSVRPTYCILWVHHSNEFSPPIHAVFAQRVCITERRHVYIIWINTTTLVECIVPFSLDAENCVHWLLNANQSFVWYSSKLNTYRLHLTVYWLHHIKQTQSFHMNTYIYYSNAKFTSRCTMQIVGVIDGPFLYIYVCARWE